MGFLKKMSNSEPVTVLRFTDRCKRIVIDNMMKKDDMLHDDIKGLSVPIVSIPVELEIKNMMRPGKYTVYLQHEKGFTVDAKSDEVTDPISGVSYRTVPATLKDESTIEVFVGTPTLVNKIIAANMLGRAASLMPDVRSLILAFVIGTLIGSIFLAPLFGLILSFIY
jgi:hypothetical protein